MPQFSLRAIDRQRLLDAHPDLQRLAYRLETRGVRFMVNCTHRGRAEQEAAFASGASRARWGQSPHNFKPSRAMDLSPFAVTAAAYQAITVADYNALSVDVMREAVIMGIALTWGGGFRSFKDRPHYALTGWRDIPGPPE